MAKRQSPGRGASVQPVGARAAGWGDGLRRYRALAYLLLCAFVASACVAAAGRAEPPKHAARRSREVGPGVVWRLSKRQAAEVQGRCDGGEKCSAVMESLGAPREAVEFSKRELDGYGYVESFDDYGKVDLVLTFFPFRANDNWQYFLVNGKPPLVDVTDRELLKQVEEVELPRDATYQSLLKQFPELFVWEGDNVFISATRTRDGGQQFTFDYDLNKTCHADWSGYVARVAITFSKSGRLRGAHLLKVRRDKRD